MESKTVFQIDNIGLKSQLQYGLTVNLIRTSEYTSTYMIDFKIHGKSNSIIISLLFQNHIYKTFAISLKDDKTGWKCGSSESFELNNQIHSNSNLIKYYMFLHLDRSPITDQLVDLFNFKEILIMKQIQPSFCIKSTHIELLFTDGYVSKNHNNKTVLILKNLTNKPLYLINQEMKCIERIDSAVPLIYHNLITELKELMIKDNNHFTYKEIFKISDDYIPVYNEKVYLDSFYDHEIFQWDCKSKYLVNKRLRFVSHDKNEFTFMDENDDYHTFSNISKLIPLIVHGTITSKFCYQVEKQNNKKHSHVYQVKLHKQDNSIENPIHKSISVDIKSEDESSVIIWEGN